MGVENSSLTVSETSVKATAVIVVIFQIIVYVSNVMSQINMEKTKTLFSFY